MRRLIALSLVALLAGCVIRPQIHQGQLAQLDKGLSSDAVVQRLGQPPIAQHQTRVGERAFLFQQYRMNNGVQVGHYLIAYENQRVLYWGYLDEFRRQPDAALNQAVSQVLPEVLAVR